MQHATLSKAALLVAACAWASASIAQLGGLAAIKIVEPSPELPGDRALSCTQLAAEMGEIMRKRGMKAGMASSRNKICGSRKTLDRQGEERKKMLTAQMPTLTAAAAVGGPVANAVVQKTQAEEAALEAKQRPERDRALAGIDSGIGDMISVMNDPRLMRLGVLSQEKQCAESMAPPQEELQAATTDGCDNPVDEADVPSPLSVSGGPASVAPAGAADPFVQRGATTPKPAAQDPFAKR